LRRVGVPMPSSQADQLPQRGTWSVQVRAGAGQPAARLPTRAESSRRDLAASAERPDRSRAARRTLSARLPQPAAPTGIVRGIENSVLVRDQDSFKSRIPVPFVPTTRWDRLHEG
jgi:hypothetical protein